MQSMPDISALIKIAQSPAGQKLLAILRSDPSADLEGIAAAAASGNPEAARKKLSSLMNTKESQELLRELEKQL